MILVDANLLIYAVNVRAVQHQRARSWLEFTLSSGEEIALPWVTLLAFLRITTHNRILPTPLSSAESIEYVNEWLSLPQCEIINPGKHHWQIFMRLLGASGTAGNLTTDAHIAALAIENGAVVYSADYDFRRFPGLEHVNPLEEQ